MSDDPEFDKRVQEYSARMGPELGWLYAYFRDENAEMHLTWQEFGALFGKTCERVDLLNQTAAQFFGITQRLMWQDLSLQLCRLTDPASSKIRKKVFENLSLRRLPDLISDTTLKAKTDNLLADLEAKTEFARKHRDARYAHNDMDAIRNPAVRPMPPHTFDDMREAIAVFDAILHAIGLHYLNTDTCFDVVSLGGGADAVVFFLQIGSKAEQERRDRILSGNHTLEDLKRRDPI